jgi:hypothetical protein
MIANVPPVYNKAFFIEDLRGRRIAESQHPDVGRCKKGN